MLFPAGLHLAAFLSSEIFYALVQEFPFNYVAFFQHVEEEKGFLCGYLKIKGLTDVSTIKKNTDFYVVLSYTILT